MFAAWHQFNKVVQLLAENGAELDIRDSKGRSPLFLACLDCDIKAVEMLLKKGARANDQDNEGNVLLFQFSFSFLFFFFFFFPFFLFFFFWIVCLFINIPILSDTSSPCCRQGSFGHCQVTD